MGPHIQPALVHIPPGPSLAPSAEFFAVTSEELGTVRRGVCSKYANFDCGGCGRSTNGRILASMNRVADGKTICWAVCSCPDQQPAVLIMDGATIVSQLPEHREFQADEKWPVELRQLFDESAKSFAAGAYTASSMVSRKILMACACKEGDAEGKQFVAYVDFITNSVLTFPRAKTAIDQIRTIGNDANHDVCFVSREDAKRALSIVKYMLTTIYSLPSA